jgi:hypothetical protein
MTSMKSCFFLLALAGAAAQAATATATPPVPNKTALGAALVRYLADHGELCVGKYDWPIVVTARDAENGQRNAVQLPAMEAAGLVLATPGADGAVSYALSEKGRQYYWPRRVERRDGTPGRMDVRDFCAGRLALDQVVQWTAPVLVGEHYEATATYTYAVAPAPWTAEPRLQQVFPMIARVIKGQHGARLAQRLRFVDGRWEALTAVE